MNYTYHPAIRESLLRSEVVNTRCEVSIPLYKLRKELEKHRVPKSEFMEYLYAYAPRAEQGYIREVSERLYGNETISREETFLIASGLC